MLRTSRRRFGSADETATTVKLPCPTSTPRTGFFTRPLEHEQGRARARQRIFLAQAGKKVRTLLGVGLCGLLFEVELTFILGPDDIKQFFCGIGPVFPGHAPPESLSRNEQQI